MELGLSLGDASKPFGFLTDNNTKKWQQQQKQKTKTIGLGFCMALGLNSCGAAGDEDREKAQRSREEVEEDYGNEGQISGGDGSDDNQGESPFELNLLPLSAVPRRILSHPQSFPWSSDNGSSENGSLGNMFLPAPSERLDVKRPPGAAEEVSSANSEGSLFHMYTSTGNGNLLMSGSKRDCEAAANDVVEAERASSRASDDDENGNARKKLRLSKQQSAFLEKSFKEHNTLNPKQKLALARQLNLRPRQVEVWFQNRRARTKLKQTEVECDYLKRCCETLTEENRRLHKELQELRALKTSSPYYMQLPATTLTMCPSCERVATATATASGKNGSNIGTIPKAISFTMTRPRFYPFSSNQPTAS